MVQEDFYIGFVDGSVRVDISEDVAVGVLLAQFYVFYQDCEIDCIDDAVGIEVVPSDIIFVLFFGYVLGDGIVFRYFTICVIIFTERDY